MRESINGVVDSRTWNRTVPIGVFRLIDPTDRRGSLALNLISTVPAVDGFSVTPLAAF